MVAEVRRAPFKRPKRARGCQTLLEMSVVFSLCSIYSSWSSMQRMHRKEPDDPNAIQRIDR